MAIKILVALDLSHATERVVRVAERIAGPMSATVKLLHVAEAEPDFVGYDAGPEVVRDQVAREFREEHHAVQIQSEKLRNAGVDASASIRRGPILATVLSEAEKFSADMLIVGSHGFGAVYDLLVGSISRGLIKESPIPVLVVPVRDD